MVEVAPKKEGRQVFTLLAPDPAKIKEFKKKEEQAAADDKAEAPAAAPAESAAGD
jgi:hypothetical protein